MENQQLLRSLPSVDELLSHVQVVPWIDRYSRALVVAGIRYILGEVRQSVLGGLFQGDCIRTDYLLEEIEAWLQAESKPQLRRIINATGVVLHTNLGRAPLAVEALQAIQETAKAYSNLEYRLTTGERGSRYEHVERLLKELTGAEGAIVVNNNAAAVMLVLNTMAVQKEVIISRGQLVEIGGAFRVPDVMVQSGAKLVEVGTTNKTRISDYINAITEHTGLLLRVHTSNFRIIGFTSEVSALQMAEIGKKYRIPVYEDQGSGVLIQLPGMPQHDGTVREAIEGGVDVVTFSGDKLLGGAQAGLIVGKTEYIDKMKRNPLIRAFRIDKLSLAALEATLRLYKQGDAGIKSIPVIRMLTATIEELTARAHILAQALQTYFSPEAIQVLHITGQAGGGSLPGEEIPSVAVALSLQEIGLQQAAAFLRKAQVPVVCRIAENRLLLDMRTVVDEEIPWIVEACQGLSNNRNL
jgi:L-seryl-tRNA(Ser) seleniumtransferase